MASLFKAAGLEKAAPRPLADRLRPEKLADVVGQDHLLGPDGALTRMLATGTLGSLVQVNGVKYIMSNYHVFESDIVSGGNGIVAASGQPII